MFKQELKIQNIPALLWSEQSNKLFIAVHGNMSHKADDVIALLAGEATARGYQVLSFDLPEHGERKEEGIPCKVQNCVQDLQTVIRYARTLTQDISLFACSMGAYFSMTAYNCEPLKQALFLSPVVDMELLIKNMMGWFQITEERLQAEQEIKVSGGPAFYWDYYIYVKEHPVENWNTPTSILYGTNDNLTELPVIQGFVKRFSCNLEVLEAGEHYFHTQEQLKFYKQWLIKNIL